jgi:hypothetical protein
MAGLIAAIRVVVLPLFAGIPYPAWVARARSARCGLPVEMIDSVALWRIAR